MLFLVRRIVASVAAPVTADLEAGYGDPVRTALDAIEAGVVGMNFEDMAAGELVPLDEQLTLIRAIREAANATGIPFVLNARSDLYWAQHGDPDTRFDRLVERLNAFLDAGADCVFAPGIRDGETIELLVKAVKGPLNILAQPGSPSITEMKALGVARVSFGGGPSRTARAALREFLKELRAYGTFGSLA
jgi:2-methylisocitrate lyase-like PEP mutase family enzyme